MCQDDISPDSIRTYHCLLRVLIFFIRQIVRSAIVLLWEMLDSYQLVTNFKLPGMFPVELHSEVWNELSAIAVALITWTRRRARYSTPIFSKNRSHFWRFEVQIADGLLRTGPLHNALQKHCFSERESWKTAISMAEDLQHGNELYTYIPPPSLLSTTWLTVWNIDYETIKCAFGLGIRSFVDSRCRCVNLYLLYLQVIHTFSIRRSAVQKVPILTKIVLLHFSKLDCKGGGKLIFEELSPLEIECGSQS